MEAIVFAQAETFLPFTVSKNAPEHIQASMQLVLSVKRLGIKICHYSSSSTKTETAERSTKTYS
jgi:hypothetical protein